MGVALEEALYLDGGVGNGNHHYCAAEAFPAGLEEEGNIEDDGTVAGQEVV